MVQVERTQRKPGGSMSQAGVSSNWLNVYGEICFLIRDQSNEALVVASPPGSPQGPQEWQCPQHHAS